MGLPVRVVGHPNSEHGGSRHAHFWALVGGGDNFNRSNAFYLDNDSLAGWQGVDDVLRESEAAGLDVDRRDVEEAVADYRRQVGTGR
jgi:hypothetical protein